MTAQQRRTVRARRPATDRRRRPPPRPTPKWLKQQQDLDEIARRRCLMVLSVLSGETPVSEAILTARISRGMYYELETRALHAMLRALAPGVSAQETAPTGAAKRVQELEQRVKQLEQEKRRADRLLFMTRRLVKSGPLKQAPGRPKGRRKRPSSTSAGSKPSPVSKTQPASSTGPLQPPAKTQPAAASTPTKAGEGAP
jgi:hypothetical protein